MIDRLDASLSFYKNALDLRDQRQGVLASNIANADTPSYKARDFDFKAELDRVLGEDSANSAPLAMQATSRGHVTSNGGQGADLSDAALKYRNPNQASLDGNTVDMDVERVEFMNNAVHYRANLQILGSQIQSLRAAMQPER